MEIENDGDKKQEIIKRVKLRGMCLKRVGDRVPPLQPFLVKQDDSRPFLLDSPDTRKYLNGF